MLTVEGTYTSGDRQGITVSHEIDFGTMQIKRNYLYKVRIALEDPAGDTYGKVTHAINVKDWTSGVTLAWAGDENLYNNLAAANFTVTGTERKLRDATVSDPEQHLVLPYNAEKSATFYVTSTSTKSGLSLTCPAMSIAATAEELALNTSADNYQCKIVPLPDEYVYNQDGTFIQKWKVTVRESALQTGAILTFTLQNAMNSALSTSFEVIGAPYASYTDIQAGDVYYANGMWSRPADMEDCISYTGTTAVGIVAPVAAYEPSDEDVMLGMDYCAKLYSKIAVGDIFFDKGFWSPGTSSAVTGCKSVSTPVAIVFAINSVTTDYATGKIQMSAYDTSKGYTHGYAMALKEDTQNYQWSTVTLSSSVTDYLVNSIGTFSSLAQYNAIRYDFDGLKHCDKIQEKIDAGTYTLNQFPAYKRAKEYIAVAGELLTETTSGWFLPSIGHQWLWLTVFGNKTVDDNYVQGTQCYYWQNIAASTRTNIDNYLTGKGLTSSDFTQFKHASVGSGSTSGHYWSSTQYSITNPFYLDFGWTDGTNANLHLTFYSASTYSARVRPIIAF